MAFDSFSKKMHGGYWNKFNIFHIQPTRVES